MFPFDFCWNGKTLYLSFSAIPGYCSSGFKGTECKFDCREGPDIRSLCTDDGTWAPYPTCQGDLR